MSDHGIVDPFFQELHRNISEQIEQRAAALASGSASLIPEDRATVAEKYAAAVSYIAALRTILEVGFEIERRRYRIRQDAE